MDVRGLISANDGLPNNDDFVQFNFAMNETDSSVKELLTRSNHRHTLEEMDTKHRKDKLDLFF